MFNLIYIYVKERFSFIFYLLLSFGIALSAAFLTKNFSPLYLALITFALVLFFFEQRLMDDAKDVEKDKIAHPERALARGAVSLLELERLIAFLQIIFIALAFLFWVLSGNAAGFLFLLMAVYSWHAYKNFYLGSSLENWPYFHALTSQIIYLLPPLFAIAALNQSEFFFLESFQFSLLIFSSFAANDVCRKLDPKAHPILLSFIHYAGFRKSFLYVCFFLILSAISAGALHVGLLLWPIQAALFFILLAVFLDSSKYTLAERGGLVLLLASVYAIPVTKLIIN